jgi:hypothetical protein
MISHKNCTFRRHLSNRETDIHREKDWKVIRGFTSNPWLPSFTLGMITFCSSAIVFNCSPFVLLLWKWGSNGRESRGVSVSRALANSLCNRAVEGRLLVAAVSWLQKANTDAWSYVWISTDAWSYVTGVDSNQFSFPFWITFIG